MSQKQRIEQKLLNLGIPFSDDDLVLDLFERVVDQLLVTNEQVRKRFMNEGIRWDELPQGRLQARCNCNGTNGVHMHWCNVYIPGDSL